MAYFVSTVMKLQVQWFLENVLYKFSVKSSIMQENQSGLKLTGTHHYLVCADNVNLMGEKLRVEHESFISC
jgi:hypothetical protein